MRNLFSGGLKDNSHLAFEFLTGVLRAADDSIFSGLNNLSVNSILDDFYSMYFGFTESEVRQMFYYYGFQDKSDEACEWCGGCIFGNRDIYNTWCVVSYIANECFPQSFL